MEGRIGHSWGDSGDWWYVRYVNGGSHGRAIKSRPSLIARRSNKEESSRLSNPNSSWTDGGTEAQSGRPSLGIEPAVAPPPTSPPYCRGSSCHGDVPGSVDVSGSPTPSLLS